MNTLKIKRLLFLLILVTSINSSAQKINKLIDSLSIEVKKSTISDSLKTKYYSDLCWYYRRVSVDSAISYGKKAETLAKKTNNSQGLAQALNDIGIIYSDIGENEKALANYKKALAIRKSLNDSVRIGAIYSKIGLVYQNTFKLDSALTYNIKALNIFEEKKIFPYVLHTKNNIANIFRRMRQYEKALELHLSVARMRDSIGDKKNLTDSYGNIANLYAALRDTLNAEKFYKKTIEIAENNNQTNRIGTMYNNYASLLKNQDKLDEALVFYLKAKEISENENNNLGIASTLVNIGSVYLNKGYINQSYNNLIKAKQVAIKIDSKEHLSEIFEILSRIKMFQREIDSANYYFKKHSEIQEQIFGGDVAEVIAETETKYQTEKKEKELLKTKAEKATAELKLNNQKQLTYGLLGGLALLLLGGYSLVQRNKRKHQQALVKEKEAGLQAIIQAEENERSKIARELHDGVVQQIGSVILNSRNILEKMNLLDKPESQELLKSLEDSNQDIRNISHQMMPRALEELGLISALDDLLKASLPLKGIKVNYEHFNITERLPQKIEKTLYRIVQELTNNILKHSKATEVSVQLFKAQNNVMLIVEDNGVGMKPQKSKGIGLLNINSRLDMVNGSVNFEPSPQSGTLVTVKIPL